MKLKIFLASLIITLASVGLVWSQQGGGIQGGQIVGTVGVANGGTGLTSAPDDNTMVGNGTVWQTKAVPNCGDVTHALAYSTSTNTFSCQAISGGASQTVATQSLNLTGCTTTPTVTISYVVTGSQVTWMPQAATGACTSNATSFGVAAGGLPAAIRPTRAVTWLAQNGTDNGTSNGARCIIINTDGSLVFGATISNGLCDTATWTNTGSKAFWSQGQTAYSYPLN